MKKKWKDECDNCHTYQEDCHGYDGMILCPKCAKKLGYKLWKKGEENVREKSNNHKNRSNE